MKQGETAAEILGNEINAMIKCHLPVFSDSNGQTLTIIGERLSKITDAPVWKGFEILMPDLNSKLLIFF